jgi:hypothetical protein
MSKKKKLIEESFNKMKTIVESRLNEAPAAQPAAPAAAPAQGQQPAAQPAQGQQPAANPQDQQKAQQLAKATDAEMDKAMKMAVGNIGDILSKFASTQGDKDGELDAPGNEKQAAAQPAQGQPAQGQKQVMESEDSACLVINEKMLDEELRKMNEDVQNEAVGAIAGGLALSAPKLTQWIGKGVGAIGKKVDSKRLGTWGQKLEKFGHKWHHAYIDLIAKGVAVVMPKAANGQKPNYKDPQVQKIANVVFISLVAAMGANAAAGAAHAAQTGQTAVAAVEGGLAGVKGFESSEAVLKGIAPLLKSMGIG